MEYKWAEADGSVTSMSPTGSKLFFVSIFLCFWRPRVFLPIKKKSTVIIAGGQSGCSQLPRGSVL